MKAEIAKLCKSVENVNGPTMVWPAVSVPVPIHNQLSFNKVPDILYIL